jgi:hypothetical protein
MGVLPFNRFDAVVYVLMTALGLWVFSAVDLRSQIIGALAAIALAHGTRAGRWRRD